MHECENTVVHVTPQNIIASSIVDIIQLLIYVEGEMECYWTVNLILTET